MISRMALSGWNLFCLNVYGFLPTPCGLIATLHLWCILTWSSLWSHWFSWIRLSINVSYNPFLHLPSPDQSNSLCSLRDPHSKLQYFLFCLVEYCYFSEASLEFSSAWILSAWGLEFWKDCWMTQLHRSFVQCKNYLFHWFAQVLAAWSFLFWVNLPMIPAFQEKSWCC